MTANLPATAVVLSLLTFAIVPLSAGEPVKVHVHPDLAFINTSFENASPLWWEVDFHNDAGGKLHISRPEGDLQAYLARMERFEKLLRQHTWFTEGSTGSSFRNPGSFGEGMLQRYGVTGCVLELNANWAAGLNDYPSSAHWKTFGAGFAEVLFDYFQGEGL